MRCQLNVAKRFAMSLWATPGVRELRPVPGLAVTGASPAGAFAALTAAILAVLSMP